MSTVTRTQTRGPFADLADWLESPLAVFRPLTAQPMRVEDFVRDGHYVVRAELPGIDPEKQLEVTVSQGILTIKADREEEETEGKHRSEFRYGVYSRHITLPASADEEHIEASYDKGIVEVDIALREKEAEKAQRRISVRHLQHIRPT
jgi:HSP20 family protein